MKNLRIIAFTKVIMLMENQMEQENMNGQMVNFMKGNGKMDSKMNQACGEVPKETVIQGNGALEKPMVMGFILGLMEIDIRVNLKIV